MNAGQRTSVRWPAVTYKYDALGRRVMQNIQTFYYSKEWQVLEDVQSGLKRQYVWSLAYVDALVLRDRDRVAGQGHLGRSNSGLDERLYVLQDGNWNVTAVVSAAGVAQERYAYDPYGSVSYLTAGWASKAASEYVWVYLHQGGRLNNNVYHFRNRDYSPGLGRWLQQDPAGYVDGGSLYEYVQSAPGIAVDPRGTDRYITNFGSSLEATHVGVAVDTWGCKDGKWVKTGVIQFDFAVDWDNPLFILGILAWDGLITATPGLTLVNPIAMKSNPCEDRVMLKAIQAQMANPPLYSAPFYNCIWWSVATVQHGMGTACGTTCCDGYGGSGAGGTW